MSDLSWQHALIGLCLVVIACTFIVIPFTQWLGERAENKAKLIRHKDANRYNPGAFLTKDFKS